MTSKSQLTYFKNLCDRPEVFTKGLGKSKLLGAKTNNNSNNYSKKKKRKKKRKFDHLKRTFVAETQSFLQNVLGTNPFNTFDKIGTSTERITNMMETDDFMGSFAKMAKSVEGMENFMNGPEIKEAINTLGAISEKGLKMEHNFKISNDLVYVLVLLVAGSSYFVGNKYFKILSIISALVGLAGLVESKGLNTIIEYLCSIVPKLPSTSSSGVETQSLPMPDPVLAFRMIILTISGYSIYRNYGTLSASSLSKIDKYIKTIAPIGLALRLGDDILGTLLSFAEKITNIIGGFFDPEFNVSFKGEVWYEFEMIRKRLLELQDSFEQKGDLGEVARKARALQSDLRSIRIPKDGAAYVQYRDISNAVALLVDDLASFGAIGNEMRREPLTVVIGGPPGIGKSSVKQAIMTILANHILSPKAFKDFARCPGAYMYNPNQVEKFVSGYANQKFVIIDDLGYTKESLETMLPRFISMVNSMPYNVEQAELHKKGHIYFDSDVILCTSNVKSWKQAASNMTAPEALCRRLHVNIWCEVKEEYQQPPHPEIRDAKLDTTKVTNWREVGFLKFFHIDPVTEVKRPLCKHGIHCNMDTSDCADADCSDLACFVLDEYDRRKRIDDQIKESNKSQLEEMINEPTLSAREFAKRFHSFKTQAFCNKACWHCFAPKEKSGDVIDNHWSNLEKYGCSCGRKDHNKAYLDNFTVYLGGSVRVKGLEVPELQHIISNCYDEIFSPTTRCDFNILKYHICTNVLRDWRKREDENFSQTNPEDDLFLKITTDCANKFFYVTDKFKSAWFKLKQSLIGGFIDSIVNWFKSLPRMPLLFGVVFITQFIYAFRKETKRIKDEEVLHRQLYTIRYGAVPEVLTPEVITRMRRIRHLFGEKRYVEMDPDERQYRDEEVENWCLDKFPVDEPTENGDFEVAAADKYLTQSYDENGLSLMRSVVHSNVMHVYIDEAYKFTILGVGGNVVLVNDHVLDTLIAMDQNITITLKRYGKKSNQWTSCYSLCQIDFKRRLKYPNADLSAIVIPNLECHSMLSYSSDDVITGKQPYDFGLAWFEPVLTNPVYNVRVGASMTPLVVRARDTNGKEYITQQPLQYKIPTEKGNCGAPVFIMDKRRVKKFAGIHCAGDGRIGAAVRVTSSMLTEAFEFFREQSLVVQSNVVTMSRDNVFYGEMPAVPVPDCQVIGRVNSTTTVLSSEICKSPLYKKIPGFAPTKMPAILVPRIVEGVLTCPVEHNLCEYARGFVMPDVDILGGVTIAYIQRLKENTNAPTLNRFMTFEESVMGCANLPYFRSINRGTSAGYPDKLYLKNRKRDAFGEGEEFTFDTEGALHIRKAYDEAMLALEQGPIEMIANIFPKDELRPIEKVRAMKTRIISGFSCHTTLVIRSIFGCFVDWFTNDENRLKNYSAVGINVASYSWTELALMHGYGSPNRDVKAGDYSGFDKTLNPWFMWVPFDIWMEFFGVDLTPLQKKIAKNCWQSIISVKVVWKDNLIAWGNSHPSGNPLTPLINTICNISILMYGITRTLSPTLRDKILVIKMWKKIGDEITITCYGDDNIWSFNVCSPVLRTYQPLSYSGLAESLLKIGFKYTDELKSDTFSDEIRSIFDVTFLKRRFVKEDGRAELLAPLELDTIMQNIQWKKKYDEDNELFFQKCDQFLAELAVHDAGTYHALSRLIMDSLDAVLPRNPLMRTLSQVDRRRLWARYEAEKN